MGSGIYAPVARGADGAGRWAAIALGFSIPISTAFDNVLLVVILAAWFVSGRWLEIGRTLKENAVALAAVILYALLLLGSAYGTQRQGDAGTALVKYLDLVFIPIFIALFRDARDRAYALYALAASLALVLALSVLLRFGVLHSNAILVGNALSPSVFKLRLTHNILMAFGAFFYAALAIYANSAKARAGWTVLAILAALNVTVMVEGATGYLILAGLTLLLSYDRFRWRGAALGVASVAVAAACLVTIPGPFQERLHHIESAVQQWQPGTPSGTSPGQRLEFWRNTLPIIAAHPLIGSGTGSFPGAYAAQVRGTTLLATQNPHNEFLHIMVQLGVVGLAVLLYLYARQWRESRRIPDRLERLLARGLVLLMVVGCLFNSLLLDHAEGLLYAWLTGVLYAGLKSSQASAVASDTP